MSRERIESYLSGEYFTKIIKWLRCNVEVLSVSTPIQWGYLQKQWGGPLLKSMCRHDLSLSHIPLKSSECSPSLLNPPYLLFTPFHPPNPLTILRKFSSVDRTFLHHSVTWAEEQAIEFGERETLALPDERGDHKCAVTPILFKGPKPHFTIFRI